MQLKENLVIRDTFKKVVLSHWAIEVLYGFYNFITIVYKLNRNNYKSLKFKKRPLIMQKSRSNLTLAPTTTSSHII